ncbi:MAG TPA: type IV pili twitching motility protein PilT, partial [Caldisericia bacterium]|nr:type IV pili twitching motility protein PilT [Caldisericia bacterium]
MIYKLDDLLRLCKEKNASDLHLTSSLPPIFRIKKNLMPLKGEALTPEEIEDLVYPIMNDEQKNNFKANWEVDFSFGIPHVGRFRVNVFKQRQTVSAAFRIIPWDIPTFEQLSLPKVMHKITELEKGFVLVTGATGTGKSTTLA